MSTAVVWIWWIESSNRLSIQIGIRPIHKHMREHVLYFLTLNSQHIYRNCEIGLVFDLFIYNMNNL